MENIIKNVEKQVMEIVKNDDGAFESDEQFCYAAGRAFSYVNNKRMASEKSKRVWNAQVVKSNTLEKLKRQVMTTIKQNLGIVYNLPQERKNLYAFVAVYEVSNKKMKGDLQDCFILGTMASFYKGYAKKES